jgi:hypothetical protein
VEGWWFAEAKNGYKYMKTKVLIAMGTAKTEALELRKLQFISTWRKRVIHWLRPPFRGQMLQINPSERLIPLSELLLILR